jgi:hypothetical protein
VPTALGRLQGRGLVDQRDGGWYIVDPLFAEWLRRASPLADRPPLEPPARRRCVYRVCGTGLDLAGGKSRAAGYERARAKGPGACAESR